VDHAGAEVWTDIARGALRPSHFRLGLFLNLLFRRLRTRPALHLPCAAPSPPVLPVPNQHSNPIAAASAANASGFLLVCLSKTPRPEVYVFDQLSSAEAFPIKPSDKNEAAGAADATRGG
jgi:hypothetical protein